MPKLRIPERDLNSLAGRYDVPYDEGVKRLTPIARDRGHLTKKEFLTFCRWKTPRSAPLCKKNTAAEVREVTSFALSTPIERLRIESLLILHGVSWPTASVLLHFCHRDRYPILDFRALWSVGLKEPPSYAFPFWWEYVELCRAMAKRHMVNMRTLDRALWQYSAEKQK